MKKNPNHKNAIHWLQGEAAYCFELGGFKSNDVTSVSCKQCLYGIQRSTQRLVLVSHYPYVAEPGKVKSNDKTHGEPA